MFTHYAIFSRPNFARNMQLQMRYVMPIMVVGIAYYFTAAIALYFVVSNLMTLAQEYFVRKHR
jgi:YidC/Oxa1 family membrane protein insertase